MDLVKIGELNDLINGWNRKLRKIRDRVDNLQKEIVNVQSMQEKLDYVAEAAVRRTSGLSALGLREEFLEDIVHPFRNLPDCSGVRTAVNNEISGAEEDIRKTNNDIWWADQEKKRLEMEDVV